VPSVNKVGSDKVFIVGGRFFYIFYERKGPKIDSWGSPCFTGLHFEENSSNDFISVFVSSLSDRI
jgi:hypothetical protein